MWHFLLPQKACWPSLPAPISYLKQTTASVASAHSIPYMFSNILPAVTPTQSTCPRYTMYFISISRENKTGEKWMSSASHHRHLKPESEMPAILLGKETFEPLTNPKSAFLLKWMKGWQAKPTNHFFLGNTCFPHIFVTQRKEKICHGMIQVSQLRGKDDHIAISHNWCMYYLSRTNDVNTSFWLTVTKMLRFCIHGKTLKTIQKLPYSSPWGKLSKLQISCKSEILSKPPSGDPKRSVSTSFI